MLVSSQCHQAAIRETVGRINAAGLTKEVTFEPVSRKINEVLGPLLTSSDVNRMR
jgi:hypothetical protein